jgi:hypothetical protein
LPFEYTGLRSLRDPLIFHSILASAVEDTALAYGFRFDVLPDGVDLAFDHYQKAAYQFLTSGGRSFDQFLIGMAALAMHSVSLHPVVKVIRDREPGQRIVGLHDDLVRQNPTEFVALTFGMAILETQISCMRDHTGLLNGPVRVNFGAIDLADIRGAVILIATNRNLNLRHRKISLRPALWKVTRLLRKLRQARFGKH